MSRTLISLHEAAEDLNAGNCQLRTEVVMRVAGNETRWMLELDAQRKTYDDRGQLHYFVVLMRADIEIGEGEPPPEALWSYAPLNELDVITRVFGIDPDACAWTRSSRYAKE